MNQLVLFSKEFELRNTGQMKYWQMKFRDHYINEGLQAGAEDFISAFKSHT